jgi:hypothetical protein
MTSWGRRRNSWSAIKWLLLNDKRVLDLVTAIIAAFLLHLMGWKRCYGVLQLYILGFDAYIYRRCWLYDKRYLFK